MAITISVCHLYWKHMTVSNYQYGKMSSKTKKGSSVQHYVTLEMSILQYWLQEWLQEDQKTVVILKNTT